MIIKKCPKCLKDKELNEANFYRSSKNGFDFRCKECTKKEYRDRYNGNVKYKELAAERRKLNRESNRDYVWNYLKDNHCVNCGESNPLVLQFDHIDANNKFKNVTDLVHGWKLEKVKTEIKKCQVLCANCHIKKTGVQFNWWKNERN